MDQPPRVVLALGSGGARGYAHIGVIDEIEARGYEIVGVAGSSMGAVIGALYAAGQLDTYTAWVRTLTQRDVLRLLDPSVRAPGAIRAEKVLDHVADLLDNAHIEHLHIPFTAVATDLLTGREVWFQRGPVHQAIRASIALPGFISPIVLDDRLLADGGILHPVPVAATASVPADLTIGVSLTEIDGAPGSAMPSRGHRTDTSPPPAHDADRREDDGDDVMRHLDHALVQTIVKWFSGARHAPDDQPTLTTDDDHTDGTVPSGLRSIDVMLLSLEAMQNALARHRLASHPPDLLISIPRTSFRTLDFHRADELIRLGRQCTVDALDRAGLP